MYAYHRHCDCPEPHPNLPIEIINSAQRGKHRDIHVWLKAAGDVNAMHGRHGWNVLSAACCMGHSNIVEMLLNHPELHLNLYSMQLTPLVWAMEGAHLDCVDLLLSASLKCSLNINDSWDSLLDHVSKRPNTWYDLLCIAAGYKDYEKLVQLVYIKNEKFEVDIVLANAALNKSKGEVITQLACNPNPDACDGTLIVVAASETSEDVVKLLIIQPHAYHYDSLEASLILGCMQNGLSLLPLLLQYFFGRYTYETLSLAHQAAVKAKHKYPTKLLESALLAKCNVYLPIPEIKVNKKSGESLFKVSFHGEDSGASTSRQSDSSPQYSSAANARSSCRETDAAKTLLDAAADFEAKVNSSFPVLMSLAPSEARTRAVLAVAHTIAETARGIAQTASSMISERGAEGQQSSAAQHGSPSKDSKSKQ